MIFKEYIALLICLYSNAVQSHHVHDNKLETKFSNDHLDNPYYEDKDSVKLHAKKRSQSWTL